MSAPRWSDVAARVGRADLVATLVRTFPTLERDEIAKGIRAAWTRAEWPARTLSADGWAGLFGLAREDGEYLVEGGVRARCNDPAMTITLYRGAWEAYALGMSWTGDLERARWFAHRFDSGEVRGRVYRIDVAWRHVLAHFEWRGEDEYVLSTEAFEDDLGAVELVE